MSVQWIEFTIAKTTTTVEYETYRAMAIAGSEDVYTYNVASMRGGGEINHATAELIDTDKQSNVGGWVINNMKRVEAPS